MFGRQRFAHEAVAEDVDSFLKKQYENMVLKVPRALP